MCAAELDGWASRRKVSCSETQGKLPSKASNTQPFDCMTFLEQSLVCVASAQGIHGPYVQTRLQSKSDLSRAYLIKRNVKTLKAEVKIGLDLKNADFSFG